MVSKWNPAQPGTYAHTRFMRMEEVCNHTTLSESEVRRRIKAGTFPPPIRLGERRVAWPEQCVNEWCQRVIADGRKGEEAA